MEKIMKINGITFIFIIILIFHSNSPGQRLWEYSPVIEDYVAVGGDTSITYLKTILSTDTLIHSRRFNCAASLLVYYGNDEDKMYAIRCMRDYSNLSSTNFSWVHYFLYNVLRGYVGDSSAITGMDSIIQYGDRNIDMEFKISAILFLTEAGKYDYIDTIRSALRTGTIDHTEYLALSCYGKITIFTEEARNIFSAIIQDSSNYLTVSNAINELSKFDRPLALQFLESKFRNSIGRERDLFFTQIGSLDPSGQPERSMYAIPLEQDQIKRSNYYPLYIQVQDASKSERYLLPFFINFLHNQNEVDTSRIIKWYLNDFIKEFKPHIPSLPTPIAGMIDTTIMFVDSCKIYVWLSDQAFVNELDSNLTAARNYIVAGDSNNCARQIKIFQQKVDEEYRDSLDGDNKTVTIEGWKFLYYNAQYILDRLPTPPPQYKLNLNVNGNGTVTSSPEYMLYDSATTVTLTATAGTGYKFSGWSGDTRLPDGQVSDTTNPLSLVMNSEKTITGTFIQNVFTITATAGTNGTITPGGDVSITYGESQAFTITSNTGYHIGDVLVDNASVGAVVTYTFTNVTSAHTISASFAINTYTLIVNTTNGTVTKTPDQTSYSQGTNVELTANPSTGYHFVSWSGDATGSVSPVTVTMDANKTVAATFAINTYTLTYTAGLNGTISGTSPQTVNYGASGTAVTAVPNAHYHFVNWSDGSTANPRTDANVITNISATANFAIDTHTLTIQITGSGVVLKTPNLTAYPYGTSVSLRGVGSSGALQGVITPNTPEPTSWKFDHWELDLTGTQNPKSIIMSGNKTVKAVFVPVY
jgi:uncharacterized repeat protein (TIGR02543 family)